MRKQLKTRNTGIDGRLPNHYSNFHIWKIGSYIYVTFLNTISINNLYTLKIISFRAIQREIYILILTSKCFLFWCFNGYDSNHYRKKKRQQGLWVFFCNICYLYTHMNQLQNHIIWQVFAFLRGQTAGCKKIQWVSPPSMDKRQVLRQCQETMPGIGTEAPHFRTRRRVLWTRKVNRSVKPHTGGTANVNL